MKSLKRLKKRRISLKMHEWINAYKELDDLSEEDEEEIDEDSKDFEIDDYVFISTLSKAEQLSKRKVVNMSLILVALKLM